MKASHFGLLFVAFFNRKAGFDRAENDRSRFKLPAFADPRFS
jgi:hypothetical protein